MGAVTSQLRVGRLLAYPRIQHSTFANSPPPRCPPVLRSSRVWHASRPCMPPVRVSLKRGLAFRGTPAPPAPGVRPPRRAPALARTGTGTHRNWHAQELARTGQVGRRTPPGRAWGRQQRKAPVATSSFRSLSERRLSHLLRALKVDRSGRTTQPLKSRVIVECLSRRRSPAATSGRADGRSPAGAVKLSAR
jgi:hypothetical protein